MGLKACPAGIKQAKDGLDAKGWSQERLAEEVGTSVATVKRFFGGKENIRNSNFIAICRTLGLDWEVAEGRKAAETETALAFLEDVEAEPATQPLTRAASQPVGIPSNLWRSGAKAFVGREDVLERVHEQLQVSERVAITAIAGMGGIGKTELALQYAQREYGRQTYPAGVCWIRARNEEISSQIISFAEVHLGLTVPREQLKTPEEQVAFCWRCWPVGSVLVVLDDVVVYGDVERFLPPSDLRFKVLMTTRQADLAATVESVRLDVLDEPGALALLRSLVGEARVDQEREVAQELCERLGYLPLGLSLVGSYLAKKRDWSLTKMLEKLEEQGLEARALRKVEEGMTAQNGVRAAFALSWDALDEEGQYLACFLGCFALAPVPWWLVERALCQEDSEWDEEELEEVRDEQLCGLSLLERVGDGVYRMHQLVWEFFRERLEEHELQEGMKRSFCGQIVAVGKEIPDYPILEDILTAKLAVSHMIEVAVTHTQWLEEEVLLCIFGGLGQFYIGQGNYCFAESWWQRGLSVVRERLGEQHSLVATAMGGLAHARQVQYRNCSTE